MEALFIADLLLALKYEKHMDILLYVFYSVY